jgi:hypothetical protein
MKIKPITQFWIVNIIFLVLLIVMNVALIMKGEKGYAPLVSVGIIFAWAMTIGSMMMG